MATMQPGILTKLYRSLSDAPSEDNELLRAVWQWDHWDVLTAEPGEVDYSVTKAGEIEALWAIPHGCDPRGVLFCFHGGGYVTGSMYTHRKLFAHMAKAMGIRALVVNYRLLPEGTCPTPIHDGFTAYRWLLDQGVDPRAMVFTGDSAGGSLAITSQLRARHQGLPLAAATILLSPWVDLEVNKLSVRSNQDEDALFTPSAVKALAQNYLKNVDPTDPAVNPLYADLTGFGPLYIQVGDRELLLDDSRRLTWQAQKFGVDVELEIVPGQQHTFQMMAGRAFEADAAIGRLATWARGKLGMSGE